MHIIPAIHTESFSELEHKVGLVKDAVDLVQVDVFDGRYVDTKSWPYVGDRGEFADIAAEKRGMPYWESLDYEFDLHIKEPEGVVAEYVRAGANTILVHFESTGELGEIIAEWHSVVDIGIAIKPSTPLSVLDSYMHEVNRVQFMGHDYVGHSGLTLDPRVPERIREFRKKYPAHAVSVDIGVNLETAPMLIEAGATHLAVTSAVFKSLNPLEAIRTLQALFK